MLKVLGITVAVGVLLYLIPLLCCHPLSRWWLRQWHGEGAEHQHQFYRCQSCATVVTWKRIRKGGCVCGAYKMHPAALKLREKGRLLLMPWSL